MNRTKISAEVVAHSLSPQGGELISIFCTFPTIILAEINTHKMLCKSPSFLKDIPFHKIVKVVQENPFIPIAWQKEHSGMQGSEYHFDDISDRFAPNTWLRARDKAVEQAEWLYNGCKVTKQLANRLLEPFMWTTMLITGSREGWDNFFSLRCPDYEGFKSRKEASKEFLEKGNINTFNWSNLDWLHLNKGQAEIHMMTLAEEIYDAMNESIPKKLQPGEWHIPFEDKINVDDVKEMLIRNLKLKGEDYGELKISEWYDEVQYEKVKISVAMTEETFSNIIGEKNKIDYQKMIELHDNLLAQEPIYSSSLEHCAKTMNNTEYESFYKGQIGLGGESGWCESYRGFRSYKHLLEAGELKF